MRRGSASAPAACPGPGVGPRCALLAGYAVVIGLAYGLLLNLWFWPFTVGAESSLAFVAGDPLVENLQRFWAFHLATSLGWDLPRAAVNCFLMVLAGPGILLALRRAGRRAAFGAAVAFGPAPSPEPRPSPEPGPSPERLPSAEAAPGAEAAGSVTPMAADRTGDLFAAAAEERLDAGGRWPTGCGPTPWTRWSARSSCWAPAGRCGRWWTPTG